jgi:predicted Zn-dependent protease
MSAVTRRHVTGGLCSCAAFAGLGLAGCVTDGSTAGPITPGYRPVADTDEGGLWQAMERAEAEIKTSRFLVRDADLNAYVRDVACRLGGEHCPDLRIYIVRAPVFNASMAPNGMMQVYTGLLLRARNEAQLAAVIGHEMGHYLRRHSLQSWRNMRTSTDIAAFLGLGLAVAGGGMLANLPTLIAVAGVFAYSRDQEREADDIGFRMMADAGYTPLEASKVWDQLIAEDEARAAETGRPRQRDIFFTTHPASEERRETLRAKAESRSADGTSAHQGRYRAQLRRLRTTLFQDELRLREYGRSLKLFEMLGRETGPDGELTFFTGEVHRLRGADGDFAKARSLYEEALAQGDAPPETYRGLGLIHMRDGEAVHAEVAFRRYLELKPDADDRAIIRSYVQIRS